RSGSDFQRATNALHESSAECAPPHGRLFSHGVDNGMLAGMKLARAKIAVHAGEHIRRRIHVKRWSPFESRIRFYRVAMAINPNVIAHAVVLPRQAKSRCVVVVNRDLDIGKGADGHDAIYSRRSMIFSVASSPASRSGARPSKPSRCC